MAAYPEWLRDLVRGTPKYPRGVKKGEEFDPRDVPVFQGPRGRFYDPSYGLEDLRLMASGGRSDVPHLAGGETDFWNRFTSGGGGQNYTTWGSTFGGRGDVALANQPFRYGQYPGQSALTERGTNYAAFPASAYEGGYVIPGQWYQVTNPDTGRSTWVQALDQGPGTSGREGTRGIDLSPAAAKQIGYTGSGRLSTNFQAAGGSRNAGVTPATRRVGGPYRDLSTPTGPLGLGTRFFETPESEFPRATPGPSGFQTSGGGEVPQGQVSTENTVTVGGVEYAPVTDPANPGYRTLSGPNEGQVVRSLPGHPTPTPAPTEAATGGGLETPRVGEGGGIAGGPFQGWSPQLFNEWHSGAGPGQLGLPSFSGNTAGQGGDPLTYNTTSYDVPGLGWVPSARQADAQASTNPFDYFNPFGHTSEGGSGTGAPTQRNVGRVVGTASNFLFPGLGFLTGPLARYVTSLVQGGMSKGQAVQVAQQAAAQGKLPPAPSVSAPAATGGGGGSGLGMPSFGNMFSGLPEGFTESGRFGMGAPTFTGPGAFGGQFSGGSAFHGITYNDLLASGINPQYGNFAPGQVGRSSVPAPGSAGFNFLGGGSRANIGALGGDAVARHMMQRFANQGGYLAPTQALVGGPPPGVTPGATMAGGYSAPVVNPGALFQGSSAQRSIHLRPMVGQ